MLLSTTNEGDWEAVSVAPSLVYPATFVYAWFSQHDYGWVNYLRENLICADTSDDKCGDESTPVGAHVKVYVAKGTHAN